MFRTDSLGRVHPIASSGHMDRVTFTALQEDVLELHRLSESGSLALIPQWAKQASSSSRGADERRNLPPAAHDSTAAHAPIGFPSDCVPRFDSHECTSGRCMRPFPPLLVEACLQKWTWTADSSERYQSALQLSDLFTLQVVQLLHSLRFLGQSQGGGGGSGGGRDLFGEDFLHDIDEIMREAVWKGEAKGRKEAEGKGATTRRKKEKDTENGSVPPLTSRPSLERTSSLTASNSAAAASSLAVAAPSAPFAVAPVPPAPVVSVARSFRRASQDSFSAHPFAPADEGVQSARGPAAGSGSYALEGRTGRGLSRRMQNAQVSSALQGSRPRQCLLSSLVGLVRLTNGLATRLKFWRGQLKSKQRELAALTAREEARAAAESETTASAIDENKQREQLDALNQRISDLESQLATAHATLHEYEGSGRTRHKYAPQFGDMHIEWNQGRKDVSSAASQIGPLQGQIAGLQLELEAARTEAATARREKKEQEQEWEDERYSLESQLETAQADVSTLREQARDKQQTLDTVNREKEELSVRVSQLEGMLSAIKSRVQSREREWEEKEQEWKKKHRGPSCGPAHQETQADASLVETLRSELKAEKERNRSEREKLEAQWYETQATRDEKERELKSAATRAKQAHASVLKDYEELRLENARVQTHVEQERRDLEQRLKRCNASLAEARALIVNQKAQIKRLQEQVNAAAAAAAVESIPASAPAPPKPTKEEMAAAKALKKQQALEALQAAEEEMERAQQEQEAKRQEAEVAAAAAAERVKAAAAARAKEKKLAQKKAEEEAAAIAAALAAAAPSPRVEASKPKKKKKKLEDDGSRTSRPHPPMAPPTQQELSKPTPKLSSGYGRCVYEAGEWYEGWWVEYQRSGHGVYVWRDGRRYEGEWLADQKHGRGKYTWPDGDAYEGEYFNDKMHGVGTYTFSDGTRYIGEWQEDMSHGKGRFVYNDGAVYEGTFAKDQKHGPGNMTLPTGEVFSEHWIEGKRISSVAVKPGQQMQTPRTHLPFAPPPSQPPPTHTQGLSRIRLAAQEQLQMAAALQQQHMLSSARRSAR